MFQHSHFGAQFFPSDYFPAQQAVEQSWEPLFEGLLDVAGLYEPQIEAVADFITGNVYEYESVADIVRSHSCAIEAMLDLSMEATLNFEAIAVALTSAPFGYWPIEFFGQGYFESEYFPHGINLVADKIIHYENGTAPVSRSFLMRYEGLASLTRSFTGLIEAMRVLEVDATIPYEALGEAILVVDFQLLFEALADVQRSATGGIEGLADVEASRGGNVEALGTPLVIFTPSVEAVALFAKTFGVPHEACADLQVSQSSVYEALANVQAARTLLYEATASGFAVQSKKKWRFYSRVSRSFRATPRRE